MESQGVGTLSRTNYQELPQPQHNPVYLEISSLSKEGRVNYTLREGSVTPTSVLDEQNS